MFSLKGKTAVITGGGSGIGASMVFRFAQQGAQVAILEVDLDKAQHFVAEIADPSLKINCYQVNVADQSAVRQVMEEVIVNHQSIDILINNAGVSQIGSLDQTSEQDFDRVFANGVA